ncbi:MAG: two-component sensor histidine kinase [Deltaproteobacteria bacterium]|nr:two-component sensor histidine kinase [Deltaproteobacteria bacterium]
MNIIDRLKPKFWDYADSSVSRHKRSYDFRKIWKVILLLTLSAALIPLIILAVIDYKVNKKAMESELFLRTGSLVSNTVRSVSYFLDERKAALKFILLNNDYEKLISPEFLERLLQDLKNGFGGFADIGIIDENGIQMAYKGPYRLIGKNYSGMNWFKETMSNGAYISKVFKGFRNIPHMVISVKHQTKTGKAYIIRATIDTKPFNELLSHFQIEGGGDVFLIDKKGIIQTPSRNHGDVLEKVEIGISEWSEKSIVKDAKSPNGPIIIGYAYITESPFILVIIKYKNLLIKEWTQTRSALMFFLIVSIIVICIVTLGAITYLVNQLYSADKRRLLAMHKAEYANKMASLGLLSAGVAHEINNPLAIINEKAGLIKDIFAFNKEYSDNLKLINIINSIISSVGRCAKITRRLLDFARHSEEKKGKSDIKEILEDVLGFMGKEAEYRGVEVKIAVEDNIESFESDKGKLQEVFLNLLTNAFAAVKNGGKINIKADKESGGYIAITISDNGIGIHPGDLERIFEPFFSTRVGKGGTGLGLSITYGLVKELGGKISVESERGKGTTFIILIPFKPFKH